MKQPSYILKERFTECIASGEYRHRKYVVVDIGDHPCGYVESLKKSDIRDNIQKYDFVCVNGGINFIDTLDYVIGLPNDFNGVKFIGWDYAHIGDYISAFNDLDDDCPLKKGKKYTTEEIIEDCHNVIDQLEEHKNLKRKLK